MVVNAEGQLAELPPKATCRLEMAALQLRLDRGPRVSGRFMRQFSLDEIPLLLCVLSGSMAIVGPRVGPK